jgi:hypothetical protein
LEIGLVLLVLKNCFILGISLIVGYLVTLFGIGESLKNADLPYSERVAKKPESTGAKAANALGTIVNMFNFVRLILLLGSVS